MTRIVLAFIAVGVLCTVVMVLLMLGSDLAERRAKRRPDPVEQHYADTVGIAVAVEQAPANDELPPVGELTVNRLVVDIYQHQIRARFKGIYGEDGQP